MRLDDRGAGQLRHVGCARQHRSIAARIGQFFLLWHDNRGKEGCKGMVRCAALSSPQASADRSAGARLAIARNEPVRIAKSGRCC